MKKNCNFVAVGNFKYFSLKFIYTRQILLYFPSLRYSDNFLIPAYARDSIFSKKLLSYQF